MEMERGVQFFCTPDYVKAGKRTYIREKAYLLEPGCYVFNASLHNDECDGYFSLCYIHFYEKTLDKESIFDRYDFPVKIKASPLNLQLIERLHSLHPNRYPVNIDPKMYDNESAFSRYIADNNKLPVHVLLETQSILSILMTRFIEFRQRKSNGFCNHGQSSFCVLAPQNYKIDLVYYKKYK
jgi:hypothetical protein